MPRLEVTLKQHTPMIHFQSRQKGASLRTTELKSHLDKYLIRHAFDNNFEQYKKYLVGYKKGANKKDFDGKEAFNYKVKIVSNPSKKDTLGVELPLFFGNIGEEEGANEFLYDRKKLTVVLEFFSLKTVLIEKIKEYIADFLKQKNFGTRQNKGFGSFYLDKSDSLYEEIENSDYQFSLEKKKSRDNREVFKKLFGDLELFYRSLRSGINDKGSDKFYSKSAIYFYARDKDYIWDKKAIKNHFINRDSQDNEVLVKDLMGLSTFEMWGNQGFNVRKESDSIVRYPSPILFKIIKDRRKFNVYIFIKEDQQRLERFRKAKFEITGRGSFDISPADDLSVKDFFEFVFEKEKFDLKKAVDEDYHGDKKHEILKDIYSQIRENCKAGEN